MVKKLVERKMTLEDAVSTAFAEITMLGEEVREAYDNTPESLQGAAIGEIRDEAASALEDIDEPDIPECLKGPKYEVTWSEPSLTPKQSMKQSRSARRDDVTSIMQYCTEFLDNLAEDEKQSAEVKEAAAELRDEIDTAKDEAEAVEFPGRTA